jgi:hypothetical protein
MLLLQPKDLLRLDLIKPDFHNLLNDGVFVVLLVKVFVYLPVFVEHFDKDSIILLVEIGE